MRKRDPRRLWARSRDAKARVMLVKQPESDASKDGSVTTKQVADVTMPRSELDRIWNAEYLERLARTYWRFLTRASLGLIRVLYRPDARDIVLLTRPFVLLRFFAPEYETAGNRGTVTWRINKGLLVAPQGRGKGFLRISVERPDSPPPGDEATVRVSSEVANFYPLLAGWGWFARIGRVVYRITQYNIHTIVTNAFLRSLAKLDLATSVVGRFRRVFPTALTGENRGVQGSRAEGARQHVERAGTPD
jgi:hypothetical protein